MNGVLAQLDKNWKNTQFFPIGHTYTRTQNSQLAPISQRCRPADSQSKHPNEEFKTQGCLLIFQFRGCEMLPILLQHLKTCRLD